MEKLLEIDDYVIGELLYESKKSKVLKAKHIKSGDNVIIKLFNDLYFQSKHVERFKREIVLANKISNNGVIEVFDLKKINNSYYLIMEDFGGEALKKVIQTEFISLIDKLKIAIQIANALVDIHKNNIIHLDINPSNILYNKHTKQIKIVDFGISCQLSTGLTEISNLDHHDGTHQYVSPEQTGRTNQFIDFRSDLYSFGITLYELFSGKLPFAGNDVLELVHCHIAKMADPLKSLNRDIPLPISDIVMKLMAKNPDDRYQSAYGVKFDLGKCLELFNEFSVMANFPLGQKDFSSKFSIPSKLYGRAHEIEILLNAYKRTCEGSHEIMLISGGAGVGKSMLINHLYLSTISKKAYFIKGKFEQSKQETPYFAICQAFSELIREIRSEPEAILTKWKNDIIGALGPNGQIIIDIIPDLEQLIGKQSEVGILNPAEGQNRFVFVFRSFLKAIATQEHPLVLFLDNLQWSDPSSFQIIKDNVIKDFPYLMLIGAYRDQEITDSSDLGDSIDLFSKTLKVNKIVLDSLKPDSVMQIVADVTHNELSDVIGISEVIYSKSNGNPLFVRELIIGLFRNGYFSFDFNTGRWQWDLDEIKQFKTPSNLVDFIIDRIYKLPIECTGILKTASVLGSHFDLFTLAEISELDTNQIANVLECAIKEDIVLYDNKTAENDEGTDSSNGHYQFSHNRLQQILYAFIEEDLKVELHYKYGKFLLNHYTIENSEKLIEVVSHLNIGRHLIVNVDKKENLAKYNLLAGEKAMATVAYSSAITFFKIGISLLSDDAWVNSYKTTFNLYKGYALSAYQIGYYQVAENNIDIILSHSLTKLDKVLVIAMRMRQYATTGKSHEAISEGLKGLALLGVNLSAKPGNALIMAEIIKAKFLLGTRKPADLINTPILLDPEQKMIARLLTEMGAPAYVLGNDNLYGLLTLKVVNLTLKYGYTHESPYAFIAYGMLLSVGFGDHQSGYEFGKLAIELNEKHHDLEYRCRVIAAYCVLTHHWNFHWNTLSEWYKKGVEAGIHSGDKFYLGHSACNVMIWNTNLNLHDINDQQLAYNSILHDIGFTDAIDVADIRLQLYRNYMDQTSSRFSLSDNKFNEVQMLESMTARKYISGMAIYYVAKAELHLFYADYQQAYQYVKKVDKIVKSLIGLAYNVLLSVVAFHSASSYLASNNVSPKMKGELLKRMNSERKQMKKWAKHNPNNYLHRLLLMDAGLAMHHNNFQLAIELYLNAIEKARENGWLFDEAFGNELLAKFYMEQKQLKAAIGYIHEAHLLYHRLGASAKVVFLKEQYPVFFNSINSLDYQQVTKSIGTDNTVSNIGRNHGSHSLDMDTIAKVTQAISSEIVLETLLKKLMQIVVENAGAQRGILILMDFNRLLVQAEFIAEGNQVFVLQGVRCDEFAGVPQSIINYVVNSKQSVVLDEASVDERFAQDDYVLKHQCKSILVQPIIKQNKLEGVLFLENNLTAGVFSKGRQQLLDMISSQIAISIENSRLYTFLEEKVDERTDELKEANTLLSIKNDQINIQNKELEKLNASKDKLFTIIAHDLKNPFNIILGLLEILIENHDTYSKDEILSIVGNINDAGINAFKLLENLLDWSKVQMGKVTFSPENILLYSMVNETIQIAAAQSSSKNLTIYNDVDDSLLTYADVNMLKTILRNLLTNAIKYSNAQGVIKISAVTDGDKIQISIADSGVGIADSQVDKIFNLIEKVSVPGTANEQGSGLGLVLCKDFVQKHGGRIWVTTELDKGSIFHFTLPVRSN